MLPVLTVALQLVAGLQATAESLRHCARLAESFANTLSSSGGKRKAADDDDDDEPVNGKRKRVAKKKDPNAPKRPASSYLIFQNEVRKDVKERFPALNNTELLNVIKKQWSEMPDAAKAVSRSFLTNAWVVRLT